MIRCRLLVLMLVLSQAAGCAWMPGFSGFASFGDPEAAWAHARLGEGGKELPAPEPLYFLEGA